MSIFFQVNYYLYNQLILKANFTDFKLNFFFKFFTALSYQVLSSNTKYEYFFITNIIFYVAT